MANFEGVFTDRIEPQKIFDYNYKKINAKNDNCTTIVFYGEGGIGKTRLLKELANKINKTDDSVAYANYDFENNFDTRTTLLALKVQLEKHGFEFPLFDLGNFYYNLKIENVEANDKPKIKSFLEKSNSLRMFATVFDIIAPGAGAVTTGITMVAEKIFEKFHEDKILEDKMKYQMNEARFSSNPNDLYEMLPELFATDIKNYFANEDCEKKALVIFFDTYEKLVNEAKMTFEERARDWWLRGKDKGLMAIMPHTLWVIAGRTSLQWSDNCLKIPVQDEKLSALDKNFSDEFLKNSGVESPELREGLYKLTAGSPIFLTLCVDIYNEYKEKNNSAEPDISEFGAGREKIAQRILKYMDAQTQDILKFLCILNRYTDDIAYEIGNNVLNFSETIYNRIKNFSFVQSETVTINDFSVTVYSFDKTIQAALFPSCSPKTIERTKKFANEYFKELLDQLSPTDDKYIFYLKYWAELLSKYTYSDDEEFILSTTATILRRVFQN